MSASLLTEIRADLHSRIIPEKAAFFPRFFKSGPGEYGEGDQFLGITVPSVREVSKNYSKKIDRSTLDKLFKSQWHEERLLAALMLVNLFDAAKDPIQQEEWVDYYLDQVSNNRVNNWDLVDLSAHKILGKFLIPRDRSILYKLYYTGHLWSQRVAIMSTYAFIKKDDYKDIYELAELALPHKHDLIHKVSGWMLREMGNRNQDALREFLDIHMKNMPRTMLRYAIEKLDEPIRQYYLINSRS